MYIYKSKFCSFKNTKLTSNPSTSTAVSGKSTTLISILNDSDDEEVDSQVQNILSCSSRSSVNSSSLVSFSCHAMEYFVRSVTTTIIGIIIFRCNYWHPHFKQKFRGCSEYPFLRRNIFLYFKKLLYTCLSLVLRFYTSVGFELQTEGDKF